MANPDHVDLKETDDIITAIVDDLDVLINEEKSPDSIPPAELTTSWFFRAIGSAVNNVRKFTTNVLEFALPWLVKRLEGMAPNVYWDHLLKTLRTELARNTRIDVTDYTLPQNWHFSPKKDSPDQVECVKYIYNGDAQPPKWSRVTERIVFNAGGGRTAQPRSNAICYLHGTVGADKSSRPVASRENSHAMHKVTRAFLSASDQLADWDVYSPVLRLVTLNVGESWRELRFPQIAEMMQDVVRSITAFVKMTSDVKGRRVIVCHSQSSVIASLLLQINAGDYRLNIPQGVDLVLSGRLSDDFYGDYLVNKIVQRFKGVGGEQLSSSTVNGWKVTQSMISGFLQRRTNNRISGSFSTGFLDASTYIERMQPNTPLPKDLHRLSLPGPYTDFMRDGEVLKLLAEAAGVTDSDDAYDGYYVIEQKGLVQFSSLNLRLVASINLRIESLTKRFDETFGLSMGDRNFGRHSADNEMVIPAVISQVRG